jgi:hypothetical protein
LAFHLVLIKLTHFAIGCDLLHIILMYKMNFKKKKKKENIIRGLGTNPYGFDLINL